MADEPAGGNQQLPDNGGGEFVRHDAIPEVYVDQEAKSYKFEDIGKALTEAETLRTAAAERAALIPAKAEDYKFDPPKDFQLPEGFKWSADANDPMLAGFRELATELKLTQPEVERLVAFEATRQAAEIKNQQAFDADQTKALGANADQRRKAASDWIDAKVKSPERAAVLKTMLSYALGVEAVEDIIANAGVATRGNPGAQQENGDAKKAELKSQVGKPGGARAILNAARGPNN